MLVLREPRSSRTPEGQVALYLVGRAAVQSIENVLPILRAKLVKHIVGADHSHVGAGFSLSDKVSHRRRKLEVVNNADRSPRAWTSNRALPPPLPHDDDEITPAENRAGMMARRPVKGLASVPGELGVLALAALLELLRLGSKRSLETSSDL
jgi:hypothetical protein